LNQKNRVMLKMMGKGPKPRRNVRRWVHESRLSKPYANRSCAAMSGAAWYVSRQ
jgi:hypothetical protein